MDLSKMIVYFLTLFFTCDDVWGKPRYHTLNSKRQRSKRSGPAEVHLNNKMRKKMLEQERQLVLSKILKTVDTSEVEPQSFVPTESPMIHTSQMIYKTTKALYDLIKESTTKSRSGLRKRNKKGRKNRRRKSKKNKNGRRRKFWRNHHKKNNRNPSDTDSFEAEILQSFFR